MQRPLQFKKPLNASVFSQNLILEYHVYSALVLKVCRNVHLTFLIGLSNEDVCNIQKKFLGRFTQLSNTVASGMLSRKYSLFFINTFFVYVHVCMGVRVRGTGAPETT